MASITNKYYYEKQYIKKAGKYSVTDVLTSNSKCIN